MKLFSKTLENIDFFKVPVSLFFQKKEKLSTFIGKSISILILLYFIYKISVSPFISKKNPSVVVQEFLAQSRPHQTLSTSNFSIAIGMTNEDGNYLSNDSIFKVQAWIQSINNTMKD